MKPWNQAAWRQNTYRAEKPRALHGPVGSDWPGRAEMLAKAQAAHTARQDADLHKLAGYRPRGFQRQCGCRRAALVAQRRRNRCHDGIDARTGGGRDPPRVSDLHAPRIIRRQCCLDHGTGRIGHAEQLHRRLDVSTQRCLRRSDPDPGSEAGGTELIPHTL